MMRFLKSGKKPVSRRTTVLTYGTFDLFHSGHVRLLQRLKAMGDELIVGCATDEFNEKKGKTAVMSYDARREILESCRFVDVVIPEYDWVQKPLDIAHYKVDIFAMGDDWEGYFDDLEAHCRVVYLPRTPDVSTTSLRERVDAMRKTA
ncbi:MAG: adenylyltransferase/cytidyltransferase family protein [Paracoccaceae bacterium]